MRITKKSLVDNGWVELPGGFVKIIRENWLLEAIFGEREYPMIYFDDSMVPNVTTMEALAALEFLLSDTQKASLDLFPSEHRATVAAADEAIRARFGRTKPLVGGG